MSTTGIELKTRRNGLAEAVELVSSMRFAISLLMIIAIAAIIGTVMQQNQPTPNYINQFGPFWFEIFDKLGLYTIEVFQKTKDQIIVRQQQELLELSTPVVKLWNGILALPLIGRGQAEVDGEVLSGAQALQRARAS